MRVSTTSDTDRKSAGLRVVSIGIVAIVAILVTAALLLFSALPDANAFNKRVERLFVENSDLTASDDIRLLEILAQSGTAFSEVLASYRLIIFVLLIFAASLLVAALAFLIILILQARRMGEIERRGIRVNSLRIDRETQTVLLNDIELNLTGAAMETLSVLAEARLDDEILSGGELEALVSGRSPEECDESAGATRIKRLRDALGNQIVAELLIKTVSRRGYMLAVEAKAIRMK